MALSIVHRATGIALYFGTLLLVWWLIAAASGPAAYANVQAFTGSIIGRLIAVRLHVGADASSAAAACAISSGISATASSRASASG